MAKAGGDYQLSRGLLYRAYFALVVCIIAIGSILDYLANRPQQPEQLEQLKSQYRPLFDLLSESLLSLEGADRQATLAALSQSTGQVLHLYSLEDFAADQFTLEQLRQGELLTLFDQDDRLTLYQRVGGGENVLALNADSWPEAGNTAWWVVPVFYTAIALVLFLLIRPFSRDLLSLRSATAKFGAGDLSTRITLPAGSSLAPVIDGFNAMARRIENLLTSQRDLSNAVSHELRTPLARLKFVLEELEAVATGDLAADQVEAARQNIQELEALIDEMLQYAELNQVQAPVKTAASLKPFIGDLVQSMDADSIALNVLYGPEIHAGTAIFCDEHQLHRALANVLRNALRFARSRCDIRVDRHRDKFRIEIADDGPGLDLSQTERIFEPFYKVDRKDRGSGYGLGLSIARSIAHKHGGELELIPAAKKGACFRFTLPATD